MEQEFWLFLEAGVPDLLLRPLKRWMIGYMHVYDLSTGKLHNDKYIKELKPDSVLHKKITGPQSLGFVLQKAFLQAWESVGSERLVTMYPRRF